MAEGRELKASLTQLLEPKSSPEGWRSHSPWLLELQAPWSLAPGTCNLTNKLSQSQGSNWSPVGWRGGRSSRSTPLCSHVAAAMQEEDALAEGGPQAPEAVCWGWGGKVERSTEGAVCVYIGVCVWKGHCGSV